MFQMENQLFLLILLQNFNLVPQNRLKNYKREEANHSDNGQSPLNFSATNYSGLFLDLARGESLIPGVVGSLIALYVPQIIVPTIKGLLTA